MTSKRSKRRAGRQERAGVALVEALIAVSMITLMFGSTVWFQRMFSAKAQAARAARLQAWGATIPGCEDSVHGGASVQARMPPILSGTAALPAQQTLSASAEMTCNVTPSPFEGITDVQSLWSMIQDSVF